MNDEQNNIPETAETPANFEENLSRLEGIVQQLEDGNLSLEDSVKLFEEGMMLFGVCRGKLEEAEGKIEKIMKEHGPDATAPLSVEE